MKKFFKRMTSFALAAALFMCCVQTGFIKAKAAVSGIYTYTVSNGTATITACNDETAQGVITIPQTLGGYPVVAIGERAFQWCDGITDIVIGDNILTIADYSFYWCDSLKTVVIGNLIEEISTASFMYCTELESVTFGSNVRTIGSDAFANCSKLDNLVFPDSLVSIGSYAFNRCTSLTSVIFGTGLTSIENNAFYYCSLLSDITIPQSVTTIGNNAFTYCTDIVIHCYRDSTAHIYALDNDISFQLIVSITDIVVTAMPQKLLYVIGDTLDLTGIIITANYDDGSSYTVLDFDVSGFDSSTAGSKTVTVTYCGKSVSFNVNVIEFAYTMISNSTEVEITDYKGIGGFVEIPSKIDGRNVTSIGNSAFINCNVITGISIPNTVTSIGENAFKNCAGINQVSISQNVTYISSTAFIGCSSLASINVSPDNPSYSDVDGVLLNKEESELLVYPCAANGDAYTVPSTVITIKSYAFNGSGLTSLTISHTVKNIAENAIIDCNGLVISCYQYSEAHDYAVGKGLNYNFLAEVNSISIITPPTKLIYLVGESLIESGLKVNASYTNGANVEIYDYTVSELNSSRVGRETVTVYFHGFADSFEVNVVEAEETVYDYVLINGGSEAKITGYTGSGGDISVPLTIDSYNVTQIGSHAFEHCVSISSIQLTNQITLVDDYAFAYCNNIESIYIPESVITIGNSAFYSCSGLTSIAGMSNVSSIGDWAFCYCTGITEMDIPHSIQSIGTYAFYNCSNLQTISIGRGVSDIGDSAFWGCDKLCNITVDEMNTSYSDDNGVLHNKGQTTLIYYPLGKTQATYAVCPSVHSIGEYAFYSLTKLNSLIIPKSVTTIFHNAISGCSNLTVSCYINSKAHNYALSNNLPFTLLPSAALESIGIASMPVKIEYFINESLDLTGLTVVAHYDDGSSETVTDYTVSQFDSTLAGVKTIIITYGSCSTSFDVTVMNPLATPDFSYSLVENNTKAVITGYIGAGGRITIPAVIDEYDVIAIAENAFMMNGNITQAVISYGVEEIGSCAFLGCSALTRVTISGSVASINHDAFFQCSNLKKVVFGNGVQSIGTYAFSECTSLERLTIPETVTSIGSSAFAGCTGLTNINLPDTISSIEPYTFQNCINLTTAFIGSNVTSIGYYSLRNCNNLVIYCYENTSIHNYAVQSSINFVLVKNCGDFIIAELGDGVNAHLVRYCGSGVNLTIPLQIEEFSITGIADYALSSCSNLVSVTVQQGVSHIGEGAFSDCTSLASVYLPDSVLSFGGIHVFDGIEDLTVYCNENTASHQYAQDCEIRFVLLDVRVLLNITVSVLPNKTEYLLGEQLDLTGLVVVANYSNQTFEYVENYLVSGFDSGTVGQRVITITYSGCQTTFVINVSAPIFEYEIVSGNKIIITDFNGSDLNVSIPESINGMTVTGIGDNAFEGNTSIISVIIPDTVTSIGNNAFYGCTGLASITIGSGVVSIGTWVFYGCSAITDVVIPDSTQTIGGYTFYHCTSLKTINIGSSVRSIGYSAFRDCPKIEAITVTDGNEYFISVNGVLFNATGTELICYTSGTTSTSYVIPFTVKTIASYAFNSCQYLNSLTISKSTSVISANAFNNCVNMCVYCYKDSAAHTYAVRNSLLFVLTDNNRLSLISGASTMVIDSQQGYLTGIDYNNRTVDSIISYFNNVDIVIVNKNGAVMGGSEKVGTGCKLRLLNNGQIMQEVTLIIYGDIDGDGYYNSCDALLVRLISAGMLSAGSAELKAADINRDGSVDEGDASVLERAGLFLETISQG